MLTGILAFAAFCGAGWAQPSVILTIQGTTFPGEVVVLGGNAPNETAWLVVLKRTN